MASTAITTNDPVTKKAWEEKAFREVRKESYVSKFMGGTSDSLIFEQTKLTKEKGDKITFTIFPRADSPVILGSSGLSLEGKEGTVEHFTDSINLEEYKTGFRYEEGLTVQRAFFSVSEEHARALDVRTAEVIDNLWFDAIQASPSRIIYGGGQADLSTLTSAHKLSPALIRRCAALARAGFANGSNARTTYPFQPVKIGGKSYFVLLLHPYACYDLKNNSEYQGYLREAEKRGSDNPIFTGALAIIDNVIIHEHENIQIKKTVTGGKDVYYCTGVFLGAGSSIWAWGKRPTTVNKVFGYEESTGIGRKFIAATKKTQFKYSSSDANPSDYGSAGVYVAITNVASAE